MNKTKINEARIGVYGKRILSQLKEYAPDRYMELCTTDKKDIYGRA